MVGLYGVLAYYVVQSYHEIGVRMALGANERQIANLVLSRGIGLVTLGFGLGLVGSYGTIDLIQGFLYGVEPTDPLTFVLVTLTLASVALVACLIPAWRATRIDPVATLQV